VEEIASDALQVLPQVLMGYSKTAKLLIRGIAENTLRHVYFSDHPVEFDRMNREKKWFLSFEQLCEYAKNHPKFWQLESLFDSVNRTSTVYSELSAGVHGRTVRDLEMRVALQRIAYDQAIANFDAELLRRCTEAVNFLLAIFHRDQVRKFQAEDRRIILRTLVPRARQLWTEHD
jgi:putative alpha-1,2-mannosidase